jgi:hypothetical protein
MTKSLSVAWASFCGLLVSIPLALAHLCLFIALWAQYKTEKKYGYHLHWDSPSEPWIYICAFAFSIFGMVVAAGLWFSKEWARRLAVLGFGPALLTLLVATTVALAYVPPLPSGALLVVGPGIYLDILRLALIPMVPIAIWWLVLLTRRSIRETFGDS